MLSMLPHFVFGIRQLTSSYFLGPTMLNYVKEFPIPEQILPKRLRALLEPVSSEPARMFVEVCARYEHDQHGDERECMHMLMATVPENQVEKFGIPREVSDGVVFSQDQLMTTKA